MSIKILGFHIHILTDRKLKDMLEAAAGEQRRINRGIVARLLRANALLLSALQGRKK